MAVDPTEEVAAWLKSQLGFQQAEFVSCAERW